LRLRVLGSGSGGNSIAVRSGDTLVLVDLGFSFKEQKARLAECGVDISEVSAVLFTHDHSDHCKGVGTFHKRMPGVPLVANGDTADAIARQSGVNEGWTLFENGEQFDIGDLSVTAFSISHDAADPVGYLFEAGGSSLFVGTDMGIVTANVRMAFSRATCAVLESNHDQILLEQSSRPVSLKQRIRGRTGHLSNEDAATLVRETNPSCLKTILLGHISSECNSPSLARRAFTDVLDELGRTDITLAVLEQDRPGDLFEF
jgi:phosphoribosyl 1,2-cyclic phosphodiesterase